MAGRVMIADFSTGDAPPAVVRYWEDWGANPLFNGWHDDNDWVLVGDFKNLGYDQLMSINRAGPGTGGRLMIADFSTGDAPPAVVRYWEDWGANPLFNGWHDDNDWVLVGDFKNLGYDQLMSINRAGPGTGGRLMIADFSTGDAPPAVVRYWEDWGANPLFNGWHDDNDWVLVGDFKNLGYDQLMSINRAGPGTGGRLMIADFSTGDAPPAVVRYWEDWGANPLFNGWHDDNDWVLVGDFKNLGYDQLMSINRAGPGTGGRLMIADFSTGDAPPAVVRYWEDWGANPLFNGWHDDNDWVLVGDFKNLGYDQLLSINRAGPGTGGRLMIADFSTGDAPPAVVRYWEDWGANPLFNGWHDDNDWVKALRPGAGSAVGLLSLNRTPDEPGTQLHERRDAWTLSDIDPWHPDLLWYARAVAVLQSRNGTTFADPTSWAHLAATHGHGTAPSSWPPGALWNQCEHGSWFFLPWHRVYLHHFERIVRDAIVTLGGPSTWSLPYWHYSDPDRPTTRSLPPAFRQTTLPDGTPNPLFASARNPGINNGDPMDTFDVAVGQALSATNFSGPVGAGFGGGVSNRTHSGPARGLLELTPHGNVHVAVGGWMGSFNTAGLDPVFWLHHANVDRIWEVWLRQASHANPAANQWLDQTFDFGSGSETTSLRVGDLVDTTTPPLSYFYSDPGLPAADADLEPRAAATTRPGSRPEPELPAELIGATSDALPLGADRAEAVVGLRSPTGPFARAADATGRPLAGDLPGDARVILKLENITASTTGPTAYDVYINATPDTPTEERVARHAGRLPMFGVVESSQADDRHSGSGVDAVFDITDVARHLGEQGAWTPATISVTFEPVTYLSGDRPSGDVSVGRVSVFLA